jgi:hypothetical protein
MTDTCTYIGDGSGCTGAVVLGRSYCAEHLWLVYKQGTAQVRKKDKRTAAAVWDLESEFNQAVQELVEEGYDFDEPRWEAVESEA